MTFELVQSTAPEAQKQSPEAMQKQDLQLELKTAP
jgi:hypothetical protein